MERSEQRSTGNRPPRRRRYARTVLTLAGVALAVASVPAGASAAIRTGSVQDPQGDVSALSGPPPLDLRSVAVRYDDTAGTLGVTWTYYDDVRPRFDAISSAGDFFGAVTPPSNGPNDSAMVNWTGLASDDGTTSASTSLRLSGSSGQLPGTATISEDGRVVSAEFANTLLAGHDWQLSMGSPPGTWDGYEKFWFDGYSDPFGTPGTFPAPGGPFPPGWNASGSADGRSGMTINNGALYTNDPDVTLSVIAPSWANALRVSNDGGFRAATRFPAASTIRWRLAESGPERLPKTVYLRFGNEAQTFTDDIILDQTNPIVTSAAPVPSTSTQSGSRTYRVRIGAKDATSGVAKVQFAVRSKHHPSQLRRFAKVSSFKGTRAPKYVRVKDRAGNFSRWRAIR